MHKLQLYTFIVLTLVIAACNNPDKNQPEAVTKAAAVTTSNTSNKTVLVFGDSLTAGYGLDDAASTSYPSVLQQKIDSAKLPYKVVNSGLSGETSAGGLGRIDLLLRQKVDVFILELGANDGLRGLPVEQTRSNLQAIINKVKAKYPDAKIMLTGMKVPPNLGDDYAYSFKQIFPELAEKNKIAFVEFLLEGVAGNRALNQADGIHPTAKGAKIVAQNVWVALQPLLQNK